MLAQAEVILPEINTISDENHIVKKFNIGNDVNLLMVKNHANNTVFSFDIVDTYEISSDGNILYSKFSTTNLQPGQ